MYKYHIQVVFLLSTANNRPFQQLPSFFLVTVCSLTIQERSEKKDTEFKTNSTNHGEPEPEP